MPHEPHEILDDEDHGAIAVVIAMAEAYYRESYGDPKTPADDEALLCRDAVIRLSKITTAKLMSPRQRALMLASFATEKERLQREDPEQYATQTAAIGSWPEG